MVLDRHNFNKINVELKYKTAQEDINMLLEVFSEGNYFSLRDIYLRALQKYCYSIVFKEEKHNIQANLKLFNQTALGLYQMATHIGQPIVFEFNNKNYEWIPEDVDYMVTDQGFITAYMTAIIADDMKLISLLNKINLDIIQNKTNVRGGIYTFHFAKFLQGLFEKGTPHLELLLKASEALKENSMQGAIFHFALKIYGPTIDLFASLLTEDEKKFNKNLQHALELHKNYYSQSEEYSTLSEGLVSLPLSALKTLAINQGMKVNIVSDYLIE